MNKCINPQLGDMLHAYELNQLSDDNREKFELHLLDCPYCFEEAQKFEKVTDLIAGDKDVKEAIKREVAIDAKKSRAEFWQKLLELFWPRTQFVLKPAITYLVILLLAYPAYLGIRGKKESGVRQVVSLNLVPNRASSAAIEQSDKDILLTFVLSGAKPARTYTVRIIAPNGEVIYQNDHFSSFDSYEVGRLIIPADKIKKGGYKLDIFDPQSETFIGQEYTFRVE